MISRREVSGHGCLLALPEDGEEPQRQHRGGEEAAFFMHPQERKTKNEVEQETQGSGFGGVARRHESPGCSPTDAAQ